MNKKVEELLARGEAKGYEVGQIAVTTVVKDFANSMISKEVIGEVSTEQVQQLVALLKDEHEKEIYNRYVDLRNWIEEALTKNMANFFSFGDATKGYLIHLKNVMDIEYYNFNIDTQPYIMEEENYNRLVKEAIIYFLEARKEIKLTLAMVLQITVYKKYFKRYMDSPRKRTASNALIRKLAKTKAPQELVDYLNKINNSEFTTKYNLKDLFIETTQTGSFFHHDFTKAEKEIVIKNYQELFQLALEEINNELDASYTFKDLETPITNFDEAYKKNLLGIYQDAIGEMAINSTDLGKKGIAIYKHRPFNYITNARREVEENFLNNGISLNTLASKDSFTFTVAVLEKQIKQKYASMLFFDTILKILSENLEIEAMLDLTLSDKAILIMDYTNYNFLDCRMDLHKMSDIDEQAYKSRIKAFEKTFSYIDLKRITIPNKIVKSFSKLCNKELDIFDRSKYDITKLYNNTLKDILNDILKEV